MSRIYFYNFGVSDWGGYEPFFMWSYKKLSYEEFHDLCKKYGQLAVKELIPENGDWSNYSFPSIGRIRNYVCNNLQKEGFYKVKFDADVCLWEEHFLTPALEVSPCVLSFLGESTVDYLFDKIKEYENWLDTEAEEDAC